jgi:3-oxoacyl-[acyl-carrier-protein] synthase-1
MRRVVVTGLGLVSSIGSSTKDALTALTQGNSGLVYMPQMQELGFKCCIYAPVKGWDSTILGKRPKQTMSMVAQYAAGAALEALRDAGLEIDQLQNNRTGIIVGTAFGGLNNLFGMEQLCWVHKKPSRAGVTGLVKYMNSTNSGNLAAYLGARGRTYSVSSSSSSGADNIGHAYELIKFGLQDVCICGAAEEDSWKQIGAYFDNWNGMPTEWNDRPTKACRPYDRDRQGMVMSAGAGIVVLEDFEHARQRGAPIYAEVAGYGAANDGTDMFQPTGKGLARAIRQALDLAVEQGVHHIDYINSHGTGTPLGDRVEVGAARAVFGNEAPLISSTKGLSGHSMGATGAQEVVYTLLMLSNNFAAPTVNLDNISPECSGVSHVQSLIEMELTTAMSLSTGLGGTNSCIILRKI